MSNTLWAEFSKVRNTVADGSSYALATIAVPVDTLSHPTVDRPMPQPKPQTGGGGKASSLPPRSTGRHDGADGYIDHRSVGNPKRKV
jgi:hypothetical protein